MDDISKDIKIESLTRRLEESEAKVKHLTAQVDRATAGMYLAVEAATAKVMPKAILDAVGRGLHNVTWKEVNGHLVRVDANGFPDFSDGGSHVTPRLAIQELKASGQANHFWEDTDQQPVQAAPVAKPKSTAPSSSVADTYSSANPWMKNQFNLTQQSKIYTEDPDRAFALATAAGRPVISGGKVGVKPE